MASTAGENQPSAGASMNAKVVPDRNTTTAHNEYNQNVLFRSLKELPVSFSE